MAGFIETHLFLKEEDYYKFRSPKPTPRPGVYLIQRIPHSPIIRVTRPDASSKVFSTTNRVMPRQLAEIGIAEDRQDRLLSHVYNFGNAYVRVDFADNWGKPPTPITSDAAKA